MDEDEYRSAYRDVNPQKCGFEKALLTRTVACRCAKIFCLAERYGVACESPKANQRCAGLLQLLKQRGSFALGLSSVTGRLPHALEMKVQLGGLQGVQRAMGLEGKVLEDIDSVVTASEARFGSLDQLPFGDIVQCMVRYEARRRRR